MLPADLNASIISAKNMGNTKEDDRDRRNVRRSIRHDPSSLKYYAVN